MNAVSLRNVEAGYKMIINERSLFKKYRPVLKGVNLEILLGERWAIIGESGSGKTTLLKVILGLLEPVKGEVLVLGKPIYKIPWRERVNILRRVGYVPQDPFKSLNPLLRIKDIVSEPLVAMKMNKDDIEREVEDAIRLVGLHRSVLDETPDELSGGMRQRVLIARALVSKPKILLLDEPTSALDVSIQAQIINLINELYAMFNFAIVTVTHDLGVAQYLADKVAILKGGEIVETGLIEDIFKSPISDYTKRLVESFIRISSPS